MPIISGDWGPDTQGASYTVGMYSPGNALVVYDIRRHVYEVGVSGSREVTVIRDGS